MHTFAELLEHAKALRQSAALVITGGQIYEGTVLDVDSAAGTVCLTNPSNSAVWVLMNSIISVKVPYPVAVVAPN
jgi:hypothetical protein